MIDYSFSFIFIFLVNKVQERKLTAEILLSNIFRIFQIYLRVRDLTTVHFPFGKVPN